MPAKKIIIVLAIIAALFVSGLAAAILTMHSSWFQQWLVGKVNQTIAGRIVVEKMDFALLQGRIGLSGVRLFGTDEIQLAAVGRIEVSVSWAALIQREIAVTRLAVDRVDLALIFDDQDRLALVKAFESSATQPGEPSTGTPGWQVRLDDFSLGNGFIHVRRPSMQLEAQMGPVAIGGRFSTVDRMGTAAISIDRAALKWADEDRTVQDLSLDLAYSETDARPWQVVLKTPASRFSASGQVHGDSQNPNVDVIAAADLDLTEVQPWLAMDLGLQGRLITKLYLKGLLSDPWASLDLDLMHATIRGVDFEALSAKAVLDQRHIVLDKVTAQGPWGRATTHGDLDLKAVFAKSFFEMTAGMENLSYGLSVAVENVQPWRIADLPLSWIGTWQGAARFQGQGLPGLTVHRGQGHADLTVRQIRLAPGGAAVDGAIVLEGQWDQNWLDISGLRATLPHQVLEARGRIDMVGLEVDATGRLTSDSPDDFGRALGITLPRGDADLKLAAKGPLTRPVVTADMLAQNLEIQSYRLGRALVSVSLDSMLNLNFSRLVLENQGSYLEGSGRMTLDQADPAVGLDLEFDQLDPADFSISLPARALLRGRLTVSGTLNDPLGKVTLDASPVQWESRGATVQGEAQWQQGRMKVTGMQLDHGESKLSLQGSLDFKDRRSGQWRSDPRIDLTARADTILLEDIWPGRSGRMNASVSLQGPLSNPAGDFAVEGRQIDLQFQTFPQVLVAGRVFERGLHVDDLAVGVADNEVIRGKGFLALDRTFEIQLQGRDLALDHIATLQGAYAVHGKLDFSLQGSGSMDNPFLSADVAVRDPLFDTQLFEDFQLQATLQGRRLSVKGKMNFDLQAESNVASGDFKLDARFDDTDLSPWLHVAGGSDWQALLSGTVAASGNWHAWRAMEINMDLERTQLSFGKQRLLTIPQLSLNLQGGRIRLPETRLTILDEGYLILMASGDVVQNVIVTADGRLPVAALAPFFKASEEISGQILFKVDARGPWDHLRWQVDADLDQVDYILPYVSQAVQGLNGHVQITPGQLILSGISGGVEDGRFTIDGQVGLKNLQPIQGIVSVKLDNLPLQVPDTMDIKLNGELTLTGAPDQARVEGRLTLLEGLYYKDLRLNLLSLVSQTRRGQPVSQIADRPQWLQNISLDVVLTHRYPFLVDNNVAYLEITPDLKLSGTAARPILTGRATVAEGEVIFRGQTFPVTRGVVDFINPNRIEPVLDIVSETQIRHWLVTLSVTGTPNELVVELDSSPPETQNDILSLILFGRTNAELTDGKGSGSTTTRQMLAGLLASALGEDIKKTTGVDILELDTGAQTEQDSADRIQVTVGKKLTSRITVKYSVESNNGEMIQRAVSEYRFVEHLLASGFQDSKGRYGGELLLRLEF